MLDVEGANVNVPQANVGLVVTVEVSGERLELRTGGPRIGHLVTEAWAVLDVEDACVLVVQADVANVVTLRPVHPARFVVQFGRDGPVQFGRDGPVQFQGLPRSW